jgi:tetratricopeptide (TPR) repeat protein
MPMTRELSAQARSAVPGAACLALTAAVAGAQDPAQLQRMFEAGHYQQVVEATPAEAPAAAIYLAAQSQQKLGATEQASQLYGRLAALPEGDPWRVVGEAAQHLLQNNMDAALQSAQQAVVAAATLPEAHYQLGLVLAKRQDWRAAAQAFDRAAELNPALAYAHYYGGLSHYRANRPDQMAIHFDQFLKLAPDAPERPEVQQIMKTVRR